jgi:hypothetical protein
VKICDNFSSFAKFSDLLARYMNGVLTSKGSDEKLQRKLTEIVRILMIYYFALLVSFHHCEKYLSYPVQLKLLPFIREKDLIEKHVKHGLGKRLLWSTSTSHELENFLISSLTEPLGRDYTRKLSQMFQVSTKRYLAFGSFNCLISLACHSRTRCICQNH